MEGTGQQTSQQPPTVVIVQQPVVVSNGYFARGQPFLRRGVKLNNGMKIDVNCISCLGLVGGVTTFFGLIILTVGISPFFGVLMMIFGGVMLAACFKFCHKAKQDYDALPQDHPDRVLYSTPVFQPNGRRGSPFPVTTASTTYQLPPGTQVINAASIPGARYLTQSQIHPGAQFLAAQGSVLQSQSQIGVGIQYPGAVSFEAPKQTKPMEDNPPSYDEVVKVSANQGNQ